MKLLLAVLLVAAVAAAACRKSTRPPTAGGPSFADTADQVIYDGHFFLTANGVKKGELFADTMFIFRDQTFFVLRRVRATFNTETGAPNGSLRGDRGTYDLRTQMLEGFGNVLVESVDGRKLTSNHLRYSQMKNEVSSDSAYTLVRKDETQRGIGFLSDPNLNAFHCLRACGGEAFVPLKTLPNP